MASLTVQKWLSELPAPRKFPFPMIGEVEKWWAGATPTKKMQAEIVKAANLWLPCHCYLEKGEFGCAMGLHYLGTYHLPYCIAFEMERHWMFPEFVAGMGFWQNTEAERRAAGNRDANPFKNYDKARRRSWDCGYLFGLSHFYDKARLEGAEVSP